MFRVLVLAVACLWAIDAAAAADQVQYAPAPAWVKPTAIPSTARRDDGALEPLLQDSQTFYGIDGDQFYSHTAVRIASPEGLQAAGNLVLNWDPQTETLTINRLNIIRDGQVIDLLAKGQKFTVLRRESNLELAMLDGTLTATVQPEDLRVGDILELATTQVRKDPVYQGRSEGEVTMERPGVIGRLHIREIWPASKPMRWRTTPGLDSPHVVKTASQTELDYDLTDVEAPKPPLGAPGRFADLGEIQLSQFASWAEVSALMAPLYDSAARLAPDSPLQADIAKIRAASADPKVRAALALHLVQEQTRYVFLGMNFGGFIPAKADVTWSRRFGDCKGKTALLLAILHELGIEAEPSLVLTQGADGLDQRLPMLGSFDHVFVRATIEGKVYWLDGTRRGDRTLDELRPPAFKWTLPVRPAGATLERIDQPPLTQADAEQSLHIDASAGLGLPAPAHAEHLYRGDAAIALHLAYAGVSRSDAERSLREFWTKGYPWITVSKVDFSYDETTGEMRLIMDGTATIDWRLNGGVRDFEIVESLMGGRVSYHREPGPNQDAPYAVAYPNYTVKKVVVVLPDKGAGFSLPYGPDVDRVIAGVAFKRTSKIEDGVMTMEASERSVAPEFPFADADNAAAGLRQLADTDVVLRTTRVISTTVPTPVVAGGPPVDATGFTVEGISFLRQHDYLHAIADLSQAIKQQPGVGKNFYNRGAAYYGSRQDDLALADFDQAIRLNPADALALMARAEIYVARGWAGAAERDFAAAAKAAPSDNAMVMRRSQAYARVHRYADAITLLDQTIMKTAAGSPSLPALLNSRCWTRAQWGHELQEALADCNKAIELAPSSAAILDSRGFVELRLGRLDEAIADYDAALKLRPEQAASLYGRGVAKIRKGLAAEGQADVAAAQKIQPYVTQEFAGYGVVL